MSDLDKSLNEIESLKMEEQSNLSVDSIIETSFNTSLTQLDKLFNGLIDDHAKGEKNPNEMYRDAISTIESFGPLLIQIKLEVQRYVNTTCEKIEVYDKCISVIKKTKLEKLEESPKET